LPSLFIGDPTNVTKNLNFSFTADMYKARAEIIEATGIPPNQMIVGDEITLELVYQKIKPHFLYNAVFEKFMYYWGMVFGMALWSHTKPKGAKMPEKKIDTSKIAANLEAEFKKLLIDKPDVEGAAQAVIEYAAYLAEQATGAMLSGRPDLADSFTRSARVRAKALQLKISEDRSKKVAAFAGMAIRIIGGALL